MNIEEMHIMFRELGQTMGLQTTRAIYSEDIDIYLNYAADLKARSILRENVGMGFTDKVVRDNTKISPLNSLYTLYKKGVIPNAKINGKGIKHNPFTASINSSNIYFYTSFACEYDDNDIVQCRIIEQEELYNTFDDWSNRPSRRYPIISINGDENNLHLDIYIGTKESNSVLNNIRYTYIAKPAIMFYDEENNINNVNCDLPEHLHKDIVIDAINYYIKSLSNRRGTIDN